LQNVKQLGRASVFLLAASLLGASTVSAAVITIATETVGNAGNANDPTTNLGAVGYDYNIGEYDVTASQYTAFLNSVATTAGDPNSLWNTAMTATTSGGPGITRSGSGTVGSPYSYSVTAGGRGSFPVTYVNFYNTLRFANWLDNGQPTTGTETTGTTETGAYTITSGGISANSITRNPGATWALESQNEWYKAAYYDPGDGTYSAYPTQSNTAPTTSQANYNSSDTTTVGSFTASPSYYGTFDQGGDVFQFNETITGADRFDLGGAFNSGNSGPLKSSASSYVSETFKGDNLGFRVVEVPEPASMGMLALGGIATLARRRRRY
jgi:formylglycine-generating enzyme required for sulfatase activity